MTKEEYAELLREVGGGSSVFAEEAHRTRRLRETAVTGSILNQYWGLILSCDAIYQFYIDTLREASTRITSATPQSLLLNLHWHLVSCQRYFAAYDLFARGYYSESATLCRTLWEIALTLAALRHSVVSIEELFGGAQEEGNELSHREIIKRIRQVDSKILNQLIWENRDLNPASKHSITVFLNLLNHSTHKSRFALVINLGLVQAGNSVPIFPRFDTKQTEVIGNILSIVTWCLVVSIAYLGELLPEQGSALAVRYEKALFACSEVCTRSPSEVVRGFEEVIRKVFDAQNTT